MIRNFFAAFFCCFLGACSSLPGGSATPDEPALVLDAIALAQKTASAAADVQRREMTAAALAFARERSSSARLRYGVLLSLPALPGADLQRAAATLEPLLAGSSGALRQFVALLLAQINERQKDQRRVQQLKDQLDELRAIERTLIERGKTAPGQPRK